MCGSAPSAPQLPQYPNLTPEQQANLGQQSGISQQFGNVIGGVGQQLGQNQNILQMISGLFKPDGTVDQNALANLQQMATRSSQTAGAQGQAALGGVGATTSALGSTTQAYEGALQGKVPVNQQLQYQQNQNFMALQEQAAQQGIKISGTDFSNAVSDSTAGQKLIQNFQQNSNIQNQNYALGYTGQLAGNIAQLSGAQGQQANTGIGLSGYGTGAPLGYLGQSISGGMGALAPYLSAYQGQLGQAYEPLYMQQIGPYQQQLAQAQANYQGAMGQYNAGESQLWGGIGAGLQLAGTAAGAYKSGMFGGGGGAGSLVGAI